MAIGSTAAMLGAAAIGTAGSVATGAMQANAAGNAADAQAMAAMEAARLQAEATDKSIQAQRDAIQQGRIDSFPWALAGGQALYKYMDELGIPRPETPIMPSLEVGPMAGLDPTGYAATQMDDLRKDIAKAERKLGRGGANKQAKRQARYDELTGQLEELENRYTLPEEYTNIEYTEGADFQETPGYEFMVEEGEKGVLNNLAALGMKNSGAALKALTRFRTGLADQEYDQYLNRLASTAGMGQTVTQNNNNALMSGAGNISSSLMTGAANQGTAIQNAGAARASGYIGQANAWGNALGGVTNTLGGALGGFSTPSVFPAPSTYGTGLF